MSQLVKSASVKWLKCLSDRTEGVSMAEGVRLFFVSLAREWRCWMADA